MRNVDVYAELIQYEARTRSIRINKVAASIRVEI